MRQNITETCEREKKNRNYEILDLYRQWWVETNVYGQNKEWELKIVA